MPKDRLSVFGFRLWLVWSVVTVALLYAKPFGPFGWDELAVCAAPLLLLRPSVSRVNAFSIGLAVASLAWILAGEPSGGWPELACLGFALLAGVAVGDASRRAEVNGKAPMPYIASSQEATRMFLMVVGRELSRARRHNSSFAVLSVDQHPASSELSLDSIAALLDSELHAYADTAKVDDRVLALVPEVSTDAQHFLLHRLGDKAESELGGQIRIGIAHYPQDAMFAEALIEVADEKRRAGTGASMEGSDIQEVEDTAAS